MSPPVILDTFDFFPKLPIELQNLIWQMTLSEARAISPENCFHEWWYGRIVSFLSPVALHVCRCSRSLARKVLRYTSIQIPGLPGWRPLYINQACDFFIITKRDMEMNIKISDLIADPTLIKRVVITGIASDDVLLKGSIIHYTNQFPGLEELVFAD
jgi:hypothetical protein